MSARQVTLVESLVTGERGDIASLRSRVANLRGARAASVFARLHPEAAVPAIVAVECGGLFVPVRAVPL